MTTRWRIELLGGLRATRGEITVERFRTRKTGALLGLLAYANRAQARETLIEATWPGCEPESGRNNLRVALAALRRTLEGEDERGAIVCADRALVALGDVETDVAELERLARQAETATAAERIALLERALELYRGPFLAGFYEDWISTAAARLETLASAALDTLLADLRAQGDFARAQEWAHRGAEAGLTTASQPSAPPPARPATGEPPQFLSRFFGRESESQQLATHLSAPASWLLTLIGPGGAGKTRLLSETLSREQTPAVWVALDSLNEPSRLDEALVAALGVPVPPAREPLDCALEALQGRAPLLCFDNFEHLLPAGAAWLGELKRRLPSLHCVATSRTRLGLEGERLLEIGALELPASDADAEIAQSAATALFLDRARAVNPQFSLQEINSAHFARLLRQLDGLPLALELAAARAGILSPAQMLSRLQRDADLPPSAERAPRQRSLGATLGWSLGLLSAPERALLAHLSAFRAPFTLDAACAVAAPDACDETATLEGLARLRDASLLRALPGTGGEQCFALLETVRAATRRAMSDSERAASARRHALYCAQLAERAEADATDANFWRDRLEVMWPDVSAALDWAARAGEIELGLRLASALWWFWPTDGRLSQGRAHLETLLARAPNDEGNANLLARAATVTGFLALEAGDYNVAEEALQRALARARNDAIAAWAHNLCGTSAQRQGRSEDACANFARSLQLYGAASTHQRAVALTALAGALAQNGDFEAARTHCRQADGLWRSLGDRPGQAWVEEIEGRLALAADDLVAARAHLEASLRLRNDVPKSQLPVHDALGELALREGQPATARHHYQVTHDLAREMGLRPALAAALTGLGHVAQAVGEREEARCHWQEALVLWKAIGDAHHAKSCRRALRELAEPS